VKKDLGGGSGVGGVVASQGVKVKKLECSQSIGADRPPTAWARGQSSRVY
jgi:hypothetical protein